VNVNILNSKFFLQKLKLKYILYFLEEYCVIVNLLKVDSFCGKVFFV
jgi:hypothetical protein